MDYFFLYINDQPILVCYFSLDMCAYALSERERWCLGHMDVFACVCVIDLLVFFRTLEGYRLFFISKIIYQKKGVLKCECPLRTHQNFSSRTLNSLFSYQKVTELPDYGQILHQLEMGWLHGRPIFILSNSHGYQPKFKP